MAQVIIAQQVKSLLRISIRTWLMDQNPCETSHFLAIRVLTRRWSTSWGDIDDRVRLEIERQWDVLRTEWDRLHGTKNPISSRGPDEEDDNDDNDE